MKMQSVELIGTRKNIMNTISMELKIGRMRKSQDFIVYPISKGATKITIQSDTRIAMVGLDGGGMVSKSYPNGAYFTHLSMGTTPFKFNDSDWSEIKTKLGLMTDDGSGVISVDNQGAKEFSKA